MEERKGESEGEREHEGQRVSKGERGMQYPVSQCPVTGEQARRPQGKVQVPERHSGLQPSLLHRDMAEPSGTDHAIQPAESFSVYRMDRTLESGKSRGGGVCLMVNNHWCNSTSIVNMFTEAVVGYIGKLADDTVQKTTIKTFPNQKPWVDKTIRDALRSRSAAYNTGLTTGDMDEYNSAFNTIIPSTLTSKLEVLGLSQPLCQWISNFLTDRPQAVRVGKHTSSTLTLSTGAPQGCVLSPLLYWLYTYDCVATSNSTTIIKFADETVVVGLINNNDETAYLQEELIVDFSTKRERSYQPLNICGTPVERVDSFRYLGVHITQDLSWSSHTNTLVKKAWQRLYYPRRLRDFKLPSQVLKTFYTCTIESVLTGSITSWFGNSTMQDRQALQREVRSAERTIHTELPDLQDIYSTRCRTRARKIVKDLSHPNNGLFSLLRSGKRFRSLKANTERMRRSFFPQAIRCLNQETPRI
ncbi:gastrula zinc finger protein XlCGF28.1-like [Silurus asotus]|uniref:Gastrula zinc finger protein XlCGF28.1-like n=1 Tax=Silurus asotus TaxID=30991 RepID=A0AAD5AWV2_SILAS|nr:gastrula zinc finger protein XlCGF28.1-like [Silurus asotus]